MTTYSELLPARKASKHSGIRWTPTDSGDAPAALPAAGVLVIDTDRARAAYAVTEFPCQFPGRAFQLAKVTAGTDPEAESYAVFCSAHGPAGDSCECKGRLRWGNCKHVDAVRALLENRWL